MPPPKSFSLKAIVRPNILNLKPYRCARDDYSSGILLDANENSFGSPLDAEALLSALEVTATGLNRYPDPYQIAVKDRLVAFRRLPSVDHTFLGVGSDEVIDLLIRILCAPGRDKILITPPTYGMYKVCANINDVGIVSVPLDVEDGRFQLRTEEISKALAENPQVKIVFLCSPGNPTGNALTKQSIRQILEDPHFKGIVAVDEAYIDFVQESDEKGSTAQWVEEYPNLVVMQTFSKSFGMAGIRLGIAIANPDTIHIMNATKAPYNISSLTSQAALAVLAPETLAQMRSTVASILAERGRLYDAICRVPGVGRIVGGIDANFLLVQIVDPHTGHPSSTRAQGVYKELAEHQGIVVRYRGNEHGCEGCLRITIGKPEENAALLERLRIVLGAGDNTSGAPPTGEH